MSNTGMAIYQLVFFMHWGLYSVKLQKNQSFYVKVLHIQNAIPVVVC